MSSPAPVHIGVLLLPGAQLLDISCVDLFGMLSPEYLSACPLPESIKNGAILIHVTYISALGSGSLASCTSSTNIRIDAGLDAPEVGAGRRHAVRGRRRDGAPRGRDGGGAAGAL